MGDKFLSVIKNGQGRNCCQLYIQLGVQSLTALPIGGTPHGTKIPRFTNSQGEFDNYNVGVAM